MKPTSLAPTIAECIASGHLVPLKQPSNSSPMKNQTSTIPAKTSAITAGPQKWFLIPEKHDGVFVYSAPEKGEEYLEHVAVALAMRPGHRASDLRLIAAAPALLEALANLIDAIQTEMPHGAFHSESKSAHTLIKGNAVIAAIQSATL
jgi:hypothetical protein